MFIAVAMGEIDLDSLYRSICVITIMITTEKYFLKRSSAFANRDESALPDTWTMMNKNLQEVFLVSKSLEYYCWFSKVGS